MGTHKDFHYSITVKTDDLAVLGCLRALSQHAQSTGNARIPWGGTKKEDWEAAKHHATFHFSTPSYREAFVKLAQRLLPSSMWTVIASNDTDPATPQS